MISRRTVTITNIKNSPIQSILIFLSVITFVVLLLALIGVIGIFISVIAGSLGILFMVKNRIRKFLGRKHKPALKERPDSNLIELEGDDFKICE